MDKRYFVKLKPVENFFFGGEVTFGEGSEANYLVKSNPFPQQTTLLGVVRKELLIQREYFNESGSYDDQPDEIKRLIGDESFHISKEEQEFGIIKSISPVFLCKGENSCFTTCPMDYGLVFSKAGGRANLGLTEPKDHIPCMGNFDPQKETPDFFINPASCEERRFDEVFREVEKIGITKPEGGEAEEDGFYKKTSYSLKKDFAFAFILTLSDDSDESGESVSLELEEKSFVLMGAERSTFKMEVQDAKQSFEDIFASMLKDDRAVLLSDACVEESIYDKCDFAITESVDFRNIKSATGEYEFRKASLKRTFLKRGSVFFYNSSREELREQFNKSKSLRKIGYNIII